MHSTTRAPMLTHDRPYGIISGSSHYLRNNLILEKIKLHFFHFSLTDITAPLQQMSNITSCYLNVTNEALCKGRTYCLLQKEEVYCDNEVFKIPESPLDHHDVMFWVYLGAYVGLVLFAGKLQRNLWSNCFCL